MKQLQFQHFRKAPHPFQQYGNLPPTALINRSIPEDYCSIPQGYSGFTQKGGKRSFNSKYESMLKNDLYSNYNNDSLVKEVDKYNHRVTGKSLETNDIQGAQGGSLKSQAVKYKQKAQQLKLQGKINGFDKYEHEKQQYRKNLERALKAQHQSDKEIVKYISFKGNRHYLNPQNSSPKVQKGSLKKESQNVDEQKSPLKEKHETFESNNHQYKQFFTDLNKKQDNYNDFFNKIKRQGQNDYLNRQIGNQSILESKQRQRQIEKNYSGMIPFSERKSQKQGMKAFDSNQSFQKYKTVELDQAERNRRLELYQPKNFPKRSLQSQFRDEQGLGLKIDFQGNYDSINQQSHNLKDSKKMQNQRQGSGQKLCFDTTKNPRRFNPTNLSTAVNSPSFRSDMLYF